MAFRSSANKLVILACLLGLLGGGAAVALAGKKSGKKVVRKNPIVEVKTSMGSFKLELYPDKAPLTVENFLKYVDEKFYDGTIFHRVIKEFMVQGGGFDKEMRRKKTRDPVVNEAGNGLSNKRGTVAMARTGDPNSATSQFFVNVVDNQRLDRRDDTPGGAGYCVFGKVISGMEVVDKIRAVETTTRAGMGDVPRDPIVIESIRRVSK